MKLQFKHQKFQADAAKAVVDEFSDCLLKQALNVIHAADICHLQQFTDFLPPGVFSEDDIS